MKTTKNPPVLEKKWEIKDRTYVLKNGMSPLTYKIKSRGILWFDEDKGVNREIRYASNQNTLLLIVIYYLH